MRNKMRLGDIATLITKGTTPTSVGYTFTDTGVNFVKIESIREDGTFIPDKFAHISDECNTKLKRSQLQENDILFSIAGAIGRTAIVTKDCLPANTNQALAIIRIPQGVIDYRFLLYALQSDAIIEQAEKQKQGVAQLNLSLQNINDFEIPFFTEEEQLTVVEVLSSVDSLLSTRIAQLEQLDELVKSRFIELFGDPETNPKGLEKVLLSDIAEYFNGLTYSPDNVTNEGTIVLRSSNIQNSQLDFADTVRVNSSIKDKLFVKDNDILMCSRNGSARLVGKVALIKNLSEPMTFGAFMMIIRSRYYPYLMTYFQMDAFRRQIATGATTTINQITGNMLNKISLPLPNMADINEFATFVEQTDKSKLAVQQSITELEELKKSLMQKYFG